MQMIKDELNAKKKSIQEDIKGIEAVFNAKKQALRDEQDSRSYEKGLTEKIISSSRFRKSTCFNQK